MSKQINKNNDNIISLVSHRGRLSYNKDSEVYENNIRGLKEAIKYKPDYIEIDTRNLRDSTVILHHDPIFKEDQNIKLICIDKNFLGDRNFNNYSFKVFIEEIVIKNPNINFIIDVKDYSKNEEIDFYYTIIDKNHLFERMIIISWNAKFISDFSSFQSDKPKKVKLGVSFIPISIPKFFFSFINMFINSLFKSAHKSVYLCDIDSLGSDKRLLQSGMFPWFTVSLRKMKEHLGPDIYYGFSKLFLSKLFIGLGLFGKELKYKTDDSNNKFFVWDYNSVTSYNKALHLVNEKFSNIDIKLFSSILEKINSKSF